HGHKAVLLVGGATGLIGDPDGKNEERGLADPGEITKNTEAITAQYRRLFAGSKFEVVNNKDWLHDMHYLDFLRDIGKHVPMRQMLAREFVQTRLGEEGSGISYAEFSYVLIQAYDFLRLYEDKGVTLQLCGSDQWGNSVAGVDLIRRKTGKEAHVYASPLVVNKATGRKFGKTEEGAIWLDPYKTTPTQFYQFWMNVDDEGVADYLKIYTELDKNTIEDILDKQKKDPGSRIAQRSLAREVTELVHGADEAKLAEAVTEFLTGRTPIGKAGKETLERIRREIPNARTSETGSVIEVLVATGLAASNTEARRLLAGNAVSVNGHKVDRETFEADDFQGGRLLLRRGKAFKDSALVELT
ncbi:MAG TPA: tyrosine--tRNA ligase, partial [Verrucomicrobiae bacterium]|nr:tyrosine--tRNA ligase [Verrucomicrobiae bacterium]